MVLFQATYHWLRHSQLLSQVLTAQVLVVGEKMSNKSAYSTGIGGRSEWEEEEWVM